MWDNYDFSKNSIMIKSTDLIAPSARVVQALELASSEIITDDEISFDKILSTLQSLKLEDKARHSCAHNKFIIIEKDDYAKLCKFRKNGEEEVPKSDADWTAKVIVKYASMNEFCLFDD
jgi:hypothetical protein